MRKILWALFGNDEDGIYGAGTHFNPEGRTSPWIAFTWWLRNPVHNLTHHVIGIYGEPFESITLYSRVPGLTKTIRRLRGRSYPYWNYQGRGFQFYFGWRASGAFGVALRRRSSRGT